MRNETGMTDEAIEGWKVMLNRDPKILRRLEGKYSAFDGGQRTLEATSWRAGDTSTAEESDGVDGRQEGGMRGRGRGRERGRPGAGRSRGAGGRGRGNTNTGNISQDDGGGSSTGAGTGTERERQRKEVNKSSRANHNRRDQRARKMARGMMG